MRGFRDVYALLLAALFLLFVPASGEARPTMLHVSYDTTRELFADYNTWFQEQRIDRGKEKPRLRMSHGASGKQARGITEGLPGDVVSLALGYDMEELAKRGHVHEEWAIQFPHQGTPFYSVVVLMVREGNPKNIQGWADLVRDDVTVLTPNPKTSGAARWGYLAAWDYASTSYKTTEEAEAFMRDWLIRVPVFDTGARTSTTNFIRRGKGDVLITTETEAKLAKHYFGENAFQIIIPDLTLRMEPKVAIASHRRQKESSLEIARRYVAGLYEATPQAMMQTHYFRSPLYPHPENLPSLKGITMRSIDDMGGWQAMHEKHFAESALFDRLSRRDR